MGSRGLILTLVPYLSHKGDPVGMFVKAGVRAASVYEAPAQGSWASGDYLGYDYSCPAPACGPHYSPRPALYQNSISFHPKALVTKTKLQSQSEEKPALPLVAAEPPWFGPGSCTGA